MQQPALLDSQWRPDDTGVTDGGDVGGDIQAGDSWSVRYIRPDMPGSLITETYYPVTWPECPGEYTVERQVEFMVCEDPADPGGTEIWSEATYDTVSYLVMDTAEEAGQEAREFAENALDRGWTHRWDGLPDYTT